jgi:hypothetical protein
MDKSLNFNFVSFSFCSMVDGDGKLFPSPEQYILASCNVWLGSKCDLSRDDGLVFSTSMGSFLKKKSLQNVSIQYLFIFLSLPSKPNLILLADYSIRTDQPENSPKDLSLIETNQTNGFFMSITDTTLHILHNFQRIHPLYYTECPTNCELFVHFHKHCRVFWRFIDCLSSLYPVLY